MYINLAHCFLHRVFAIERNALQLRIEINQLLEFFNKCCSS